MFKLLGNNYYSPTATEVAIGLRSSKLFLPKNHILDGSSICRLIIFFVVITSLLWKCKSTHLFLIAKQFCKFFHFYPPPKQFCNALAMNLHLQRNSFWERAVLKWEEPYLKRDWPVPKTTITDNLISSLQKNAKYIKDYLP